MKMNPWGRPAFAPSVENMAVVHRNGRSYIYRSVRRNGRVTSEYGGSGECALLIAQMETIERDARRPGFANRESGATACRRWRSARLTRC